MKSQITIFTLTVVLFLEVIIFHFLKNLDINKFYTRVSCKIIETRQFVSSNEFDNYLCHVIVDRAICICQILKTAKLQCTVYVFYKFYCIQFFFLTKGENLTKTIEFSWYKSPNCQSDCEIKNELNK